MDRTKHTIDRVCRRWDWRLSARIRLASLGSVWVLVFLASLLAPVLPILGALRMAISGVQLMLNQKLARRRPIAGRDRYDWALLGLAFAGSVFAASIVRITGDAHDPLIFLPVLLPYSALQARSFQRSNEAHRLSITVPRSPLPISLPLPVSLDSVAA